MCGMSGALWRGSPPDGEDFGRRLARMSATLRRRGPDHEAVWVDGGIGLAHNRLSIIDLSPAAYQPLAYASGRIRVMSNGEIYNFRELRAELEGLGQKFRTRSDTEVVAAGYACWGTNVFSRLRGMFAIAIWDSVERCLILARDRIGKKPLCYAQTPDAFLFASESKAILAWPGFEKRPDWSSLHRYLAYQYVPEPSTGFAGIGRLAPGHMMIVGDSGALRTERYADWPRPASGPSGGDPVAVVRELVDSAVRMRLVSDVPVGAFLSGGLESSTVVAVMARHLGGSFHTFSVGFEDDAFDERPYARAVANRYGTQHHELVVGPSDAEILPRLAWLFGDPYGDSSALPTYLLAQAARREVGVVLTGDGGDELFLGYDSYRAHASNAWVERVPMGIRRLAAGLDRWCPEYPSEGRLRRVLRRNVRRLDPRGSARHMAFMGAFRNLDRKYGYGAAFSAWREDDPSDALEQWFEEVPNVLTGASWCDLHSYLPGDLLVKMDIATMAHGLEARSPLLDQELVGWAVGQPAEIRRRGGRPKGLMRDAFGSELPPEIVLRPKRGFSVPMESWLRGPLFAPMQAALTSARARERGLFDPRFVERLLDEHRAGKALHHTRLWSMWMLELWFRCWMDRSAEDALRDPAAL